MNHFNFYNANNLGGVDHRPHFRWLAEQADSAAKARISRFMADHKDATWQSRPLRRIVLLEDFVGVGSQIKKAIRFAATLTPTVEVLFVPLIICPRGAQEARDIAAAHTNVQYAPIVELGEELFINGDSRLARGSLESAIRRLAL